MGLPFGGKSSQGTLYRCSLKHLSNVFFKFNYMLETLLSKPTGQSAGHLNRDLRTPQRLNVKKVYLGPKP